MSMYEQISVLPIYESGLVMFNIICGTVILNEGTVYTWKELIIIVISAGICVVGCIMLARIEQSTKRNIEVVEVA